MIAVHCSPSADPFLPAPSAVFVSAALATTALAAAMDRTVTLALATILVFALATPFVLGTTCNQNGVGFACSRSDGSQSGCYSIQSPASCNVCDVGHFCPGHQTDGSNSFERKPWCALFLLMFHIRLCFQTHDFCLITVILCTLITSVWSNIQRLGNLLCRHWPLATV